MKACDLSIIDRTREQLLALGARRGPIVVGPWLSEVGFELLYWIPFLRWAVAFAGLRRDDLWIVSRGGCRSWYADISAQYLDALDIYTPEQFRTGNARRVAEQTAEAAAIGLRHGRQSSKQHIVTAFDREVLTHATTRAGLTDVRVLHPSMLYGLFRPFWVRKAPMLYAEMTTPAVLTAPVRPAGLPADYVAAKFYASAACPLTGAHIGQVADALRAVAAQTDVVLLHQPRRYDEHGEFPVPAHPRVHRVSLTPETNLDTQTAVLAGARAYLGTYGGFAYLAPFLRVPARTFYTSPNFRKDHRAVLDGVARGLGVPFTVELLGGGVSARRKAKRYAA